MRPLGLRYLNPAEISAEAGGDPWTVDEGLQTGDAAAIDDLAGAYRSCSGCVGSTEDAFVEAKKRFQDAYRRNGSQHPINDSAEVTATTTRLKSQKEQIGAISADLETIAAALAVAQRDSEAAVATLNTMLHGIDDQIGAALAANQDSSKLHDTAVQAVESTLTDVKTVRDTYSSTMKTAQSEMLGATGYRADVLDAVDAMPDAVTDEARQYDQSQRAADEAAVRKASAEGQPTDASRAAENRLRDYATIQDPSSSAEARKLAGERLADSRISQIVGPLPPDTVLGGDARSRAQARLKLQQMLESGKYQPQGAPPMTRDQITAELDRSEALGRTMVLSRAEAELERQGVSPEAAHEVVDEIEHGSTPADAMAKVSSKIGAMGEGLAAFGEKVDHGRHWANSAPLTPMTLEDAERLAKYGKVVGYAGSLVEVGSAVWDYAHGGPIGKVAEAGGSAGGAWGGAWAGGEIGGFVGGPWGAAGGAIFGAVLGGLGGEALVKELLGE